MLYNDQLRAGLPTLPPHMASLPVFKGYPVPYFVGLIDGVPDFRLVDPLKLKRCLEFEACWLCGKPLGAHRHFVIGPMCVVNRITSEPPSHLDCAHFAVEACPHLINPGAKRRSANLPDELRHPAGTMVPDNPGVTVIWESKTYSVVNAPDGGELIDIGDPEAIEWWKDGHRASRAEVVPLFEKSVGRLRKVAEDRLDREHASAATRVEEIAALDVDIGRAMRWFLPPE
jgi:hypothetical protein